MSTEHLLDTKGKVNPKPVHDAAAGQKDNQNRPLTTAQIQGKLDPSTITQMQRTVGNASVQRFLAQRSGQGPSPVDDDTAGLINNRRGSGSTLDDGIANKAGAVMGQDFSGVNVHTDSTADNLSRDLGAVAFTTGNDIFFRSGAYNPKSSDGQKLISHELTHVVQQGASAPSVQSKMTVNDPNDQYEKEADSVAEQVMSKPDDVAVQQQEEEMPEDEIQEKAVQRQEEEMPEDEIQEKSVQRQEEDEMLQGKRVQREEVMEDESIGRKADIQRHDDHEQL